jgi:hypothetical protein
METLNHELSKAEIISKLNNMLLRRIKGGGNIDHPRDMLYADTHHEEIAVTVLNATKNQLDLINKYRKLLHDFLVEINGCCLEAKDTTDYSSNAASFYNGKLELSNEIFKKCEGIVIRVQEIEAEFLLKKNECISLLIAELNEREGEGEGEGEGIRTM